MAILCLSRYYIFLKYSCSEGISVKIILAPDSFKGNGGEGTVQSLIDGIGGKFIRKRVIGPDGKTVSARYGLLSDGKTAVIEMAEASGLPLLSDKNKNPMKTTTFGTGELIIDAAKRGAKKIIIGIGGSATNDGGVGMAQAIGACFFDNKGKKITEYGSGGMLKKIATIAYLKFNFSKTNLLLYIKKYGNLPLPP